MLLARDDDDDDDEDVQKADTAPKDEDMDRKGDNNECHNVPLQKDLVSSTRKKQVFVDLDDDDDDDDENVQKADMDIDENIDRNGANNEYHNAFLQKNLVISTRKKRIFIDFEDDDDDEDDGNESKSPYKDIEKIDLQNLKVEKIDNDNNFNRYQNEDALQAVDDNQNGNYCYGLTYTQRFNLHGPKRLTKAHI